MVVFECESCGANLKVEDGMTVCECDYCGTRQVVPEYASEGSGAIDNVEELATIRNKSKWITIGAVMSMAILATVVCLLTYHRSQEKTQTIEKTSEEIVDTSASDTREADAVREEYKNCKPSEIYDEAVNQMKEGSLNLAYVLLQMLPTDYKDSARLREMVEFYLPYNRTYRRSYGVQSVAIVININPEDERVHIRSTNMTLLDDTVNYGKYFIKNEGKNYKISLNLKTGEFIFYTNGNRSNRSGTYNH